MLIIQSSILHNSTPAANLLLKVTPLKFYLVSLVSTLKCLDNIYILQNTKYYLLHGASQVKLVVKNPPAIAGDVRDVALIPGSCMDLRVGL